MYGGGGLQGSLGTSKSRTPSGGSWQNYAVGEFNVGWGKSAGGAINLSETSGAIGKGIVPRLGAGYGGMVAAGGGRAYNWASNPLYCN